MMATINFLFADLFISLVEIFLIGWIFAIPTTWLMLIKLMLVNGICAIVRGGSDYAKNTRW